MKIDLTPQLEDAAEKAAKTLLEQKSITEINYLENRFEKVEERARESRVSNRDLIARLLKNGGNVYALWSRDPAVKEWQLRYIGQRRSGHIHQRLNEHLFWKSAKTGSKLHEVHQCISDGLCIGISVVNVIPDVARTSIEEFLIKAHLPGWNKHR